MLVGDGSHPLDRQFRVGSPFGIPLYFHIILLVFLGVWLLMSLVPFNLGRILWPLLLMFSVYLHELGHALTSAYFGRRPRRIVLHLFGGVAEVPPGLNTKQELWVIAGGPLVSLALAIIGFALMPLAKGTHYLFYFLMASMFQINTILFIFNVLPIYPLDGGQFTRQWILLRKGQTAAIRRSLPLSMVTLIVMGVISLVFQWIGFLGLVIALSLFMVNHQEYQRWSYLFSDGFWSYMWPFGGGGSRKRGASGDRWPGERDEEPSRSGGGIGDQLFVKMNKKKAEKLMKKADEVGIFNLSKEERELLERYLDAKISIKEKNYPN
jgi:Zn-dependent protease